MTGRSGYELPITYEEATAIEYCGALDYSAFSASVKSELQSTLPRGGRQVIADVDPVEIRFQPTPPRGGRRDALAPSGELIDISTHAPAWGATIFFLDIPACTCDFNPRPRVGGDGHIDQ